MPIMGFIGESNNVRPIVQQCHDEGKTGILHFVLNTRRSACGTCEFRTSFLDMNNKKLLIQDPEDITFENETLIKANIICPDCLNSAVWKEFKGTEREI